MKKHKARQIVFIVATLLISGVVSYAAAWFQPIMPSVSYWTYTTTPFAFLAVFMGSNGLLMLLPNAKDTHPTRKKIFGFLLVCGSWTLLEAMAQILFIKH